MLCRRRGTQRSSSYSVSRMQRERLRVGQLQASESNRNCTGCGISLNQVRVLGLGLPPGCPQPLGARTPCPVFPGAVRAEPRLPATQCTVGFLSRGKRRGLPPERHGVTSVQQLVYSYPCSLVCLGRADASGDQQRFQISSLTCFRHFILLLGRDGTF